MWGRIELDAKDRLNWPHEIPGNKFSLTQIQPSCKKYLPFTTQMISTFCGNACALSSKSSGGLHHTQVPCATIVNTFDAYRLTNLSRCSTLGMSSWYMSLRHILLPTFALC